MEIYECPGCGEASVCRNGNAPASQYGEIDYEGDISGSSPDVECHEDDIEWNNDWECTGCGRSYDADAWRVECCDYCEMSVDSCDCSFCDNCDCHTDECECTTDEEKAAEVARMAERRLQRGRTINPFREHLTAHVMGGTPNG